LTRKQNPGYTIFPVLQRLDQFDKTGMQREQMLRHTTFEEENLVLPVSRRPKHAP
jgi:hypothetical protein